MPAATLVELFETLGEKSYRAKQVMQWLYQRDVTDFDAMTDSSASLRKELGAIANADLPPCSRRSIPPTARASGCLHVGAAQAVEMVFIPDRSRHALHLEPGGLRARLCVLRDGPSGLQPQPPSAEIMGRSCSRRELTPESTPITNVVFMGMGEPLANYRNVLPVVQILLDDVAFGLSRRRVTISTAGVVPQIDKLAKRL